MTAPECTHPRLGVHRCAVKAPGHRVHVCRCSVFLAWNDQGFTYRGWVAAGRPTLDAAATTVEPPPPG